MSLDVDLDDSAISVMEELDPEPEQVGRRTWWRSSYMREVVLGLLLLLGVLGWAGFTWWRDESNRSDYAQAQQAAALRHWDEALGRYSAASGYKDADTRAADALRQIQERDSRYDAVRAYQRKGPAARMLLAARAVQTIQPGYKDIDKLALQAENQLYTDALSGTVVMRTNAQPPGLYYRGSAGWWRLEGSDQWSSVLSLPFSEVSRKRVVYDVPGPGWTPPVPLTRPLFDPYGYEISEGSPNKLGRRLIMAKLPDGSEEPEFEDLQLNPSEYNFYICGKAGVWGVRYDPGRSNRVLAKGILNSFILTYEETAPQATGLVRQPAEGSSGSRVAPVVMPGADGEVADFGHSSAGSDKLLLAGHNPGTNNEAVTHLYLTGADGSEPRLVYSTSGTLVSALLSPDDRHVLVVASQSIESFPDKALVVATLLTLDGTVPPKTLQKISVDGALARSPGISTMLTGQLTISGVFLENGAFKNKLLLGWSEDAPATSVTVRLLDVYNPDKTLAETTIPYAHTGVLPVLEQDDGRTLLLYNQGVASTSGAGKSLTAHIDMLHAEAGTDYVRSGSYNVPLPQSNTSSATTPYFMNPTLRGANLIYNVETYSTMPDSSNIYSLPLAALGDQERQATDPMQLFSRSWSAGPAAGSGGPALGVAGPGAYAYTDSQGALHAHLYDAEVDVTLESGVGTILALNASYFYKVLH